MSDTSIVEQGSVERDARGRFLVGHKPGPGRPVGARNHLSEQFLRSLAVKWEAQGDAALDRVIKNDPSTFVKVIASLLPRDFNLSMVDGREKDDILRDLVQQVGSPAAALAQLDAIKADIERMAADEARIIEDHAT